MTKAQAVRAEVIKINKRAGGLNIGFDPHSTESSICMGASMGVESIIQDDEITLNSTKQMAVLTRCKVKNMMRSIIDRCEEIIEACK